MKYIHRMLWVVIIAGFFQVSCIHVPQESPALFQIDGDISRVGSGWTYEAASEDEIVYIPFEGMYPNKGGRTQSPWFTLPDTNGQGAYYRLTFKAKTAEHCYWWLDYQDENGVRLSDCNSKVYPSDEIRDYDEIVYVQGAARKAQVAFVSKKQVEVSDVRFTTATLEEAVQWCDNLYGTIPPLKFTAPADSMELLPKTAAAMKDGTPWRVVMLGHSIMNDSYNSLFMALVKRDFPGSNFNVLPSVRGSTGCSYYRQPEQFEKYVVARKPDLLMIIDNSGGEDLAEVVRLTREQVGCEILVINMPLAGDWRAKYKTLDWRSLAKDPKGSRYDINPIREGTKKLNVAFWDMTTPCNDYLATAGELDFTRDYVHNNDVGKQIIGRVLHQYFLTAK